MADETDKPAATSDDKLVALALRRYKLAADAEASQRKRELEDLKFARGRTEDQWPQAALSDRSGYNAGGGSSVAPRPCLTINRLKQPLDLVENQVKGAKLSIHFAPDDDEADTETAELYEDIARAVQVDSRAHLARNWAFRRAIRGGRGFYRLVTEYANDGDLDLDIVYKRILNQGCVFIDPFCQEPDNSDADWQMIVEDLPVATFKRRYPKSKMAGMDDGELTSLGDEAPDWVGGDDEASRTIRVAEYFYLERKIEKKTHGQGETARERDHETRIVHQCKITAKDKLEATIWNGRYIPIIPVVADEDVVDGERSYQGIVRPAADSQRAYNYMRSSEVEAIGLAPKAPFIGAEGQFEGHTVKWNSANTKNWAYLEYKPVSYMGILAPPPQRDVQEPAIQAIMLSSRNASDDIHATTGVPPVSLGNLDKHERSGKAMVAAQQMAEAGTSGYLDNLASISMLYEGKVLRDLIPRVYDRPGRIVHAVGADDTRRAVMLGQPYTMQGGRPTAVPPQTEGAKVYDLEKGQYTVSVVVGKGYTTKREENFAALSETISTSPELMLAIGDLWAKQSDAPGMDEVSERLKFLGQTRGMIPPDQEGSENIPPAARAKMQQQEQMLQQLQQQLQQASQIIQTDQVKTQGQLQIAQVKESADSQREMAKLQLEQQRAQAELQIQIEELAAKERLEMRKLEVQLEIELAKLGSAQSMARAELEQQDLHHHDAQQLAEQDAQRADSQQVLDEQARQEEAAAQERAATQEAKATT